MEVIRTIREMHVLAEKERRAGKTIGVVPTMGSLHRGHTSLIRLAASQSQIVVTTIFVNPAQFGPNEDFERYPRNMARDEILAAEAGTHILFCPEVADMYPEGYRTYVFTEELSSVLEGAVRPDHFRGVTTIVLKLLNITRPHIAVFGQKDAQQVAVIRKMVRDLNLDVQLSVGPIVREPDGLAMSSRNAYLSADERGRATALSRSLHQAEADIQKGEHDVEHVRAAMLSILEAAHPDAIDYVAFVHPDSFREIRRIQPP
jgi:pantoate--beta-alanine ligase